MTTTDGTPVTVLSGALGAGKTTTLTHLLEHADRRLAVLVNDVGEINVDAALVESRADGVAELSNGCICCDLRDDLEIEVSRLARERDFDHLVVESSGISEPAPVARLFTTGAASAAYELDTLATVVDAAAFRRTLADGEGEGEGGRETTEADGRVENVGNAETVESAGGDDGPRPLSELLVAQVECAGVVVLNKCDLADEAALAETEELIWSLNPRARIVRTVHGDLEPEAIVGTGRFDLDTVSETDGWRRALEHAEHHRDEGEEQEHDDSAEHGHADHADRDHAEHHPAARYGVDSFAYRRRRPFHPGRLADALRDLPSSVVRSKGLLWVAGRDEVSLHYGQAGPSSRVEVQGAWIASLDESRREMQRRMHPEIEWDEEHGDRQSQLVFIGTEMDEESIVAALDAALVTDDEWNSGTYGENPFPDAGDDPLVLR
ncbi:CobW family GTP-binding protein [Halomarina pelagica]|uniref:CobW family GTP-binding protein n=1 Tax=Halomarina pelagica TaxID=2961599 RepID=UPI0020C3E629|nr:GTP-binding protein [Halomarina sp. BND7]